MAEEEYVNYDKYRADLSDFRAAMANFREEVRGEVSGMRQDITTLSADLRGEISGIRQDMTTLSAELRGEMTTLRAELLTNMSQLETRLMRWMLVAAALGGLMGGLVAAVSKLLP
ncbi:MAG: hypothetical protein ETSY1_29365 [Candidatus Entotheonella factor]|uniref:DUF1640 domain-containing protein n=1 Tax=Entotheonella factor TaxID=1429438 RepID=W4LCT7_ENTF1|nr:MAG: hypothetical protein ETSY1_29365 [Candidatus Entotheonella factor]